MSPRRARSLLGSAGALLWALTPAHAQTTILGLQLSPDITTAMGSHYFCDLGTAEPDGQT